MFTIVELIASACQRKPLTQPYVPRVFVLEYIYIHRSYVGMASLLSHDLYQCSVFEIRGGPYSVLFSHRFGDS